MTIKSSSDSPLDSSYNPSPSSLRQIILTSAVVDIEKTAAWLGWNHAPSLHALITTRILLSQPGLPVDIITQVRKGWDGSEGHLSAIMQEGLVGDELEEILARLARPPQVRGAVLTVGHLIVSPGAKE